MIGDERNRMTIKGEGTSEEKLNTTNITKLFILHLLSKKSYYASEISDKIFEECSWRPSNGLLYPLLLKMEDNGWVESWWEEPNKKTIRFFKITDAGIKHYKLINSTYKEMLEDNQRFIIKVLNSIYK